ncbi:MAG: hypothetical protein SGCHY_002373, partial [Lobulomycetales sp.]
MFSPGLSRKARVVSEPAESSKDNDHHCGTPSWMSSAGKLSVIRTLKRKTGWEGYRSRALIFAKEIFCSLRRKNVHIVADLLAKGLFKTDEPSVFKEDLISQLDLTLTGFLTKFIELYDRYLASDRWVSLQKGEKRRTLNDVSILAIIKLAYASAAEDSTDEHFFNQELDIDLHFFNVLIPLYFQETTIDSINRLQWDLLANVFDFQVCIACCPTETFYATMARNSTPTTYKKASKVLLEIASRNHAALMLPHQIGLSAGICARLSHGEQPVLCKGIYSRYNADELREILDHTRILVEESSRFTCDRESSELGVFLRWVKGENAFRDLDSLGNTLYTQEDASEDAHPEEVLETVPAEVEHFEPRRSARLRKMQQALEEDRASLMPSVIPDVSKPAKSKRSSRKKTAPQSHEGLRRSKRLAAKKRL